jgi:hypothetical protein
MNYVLTKTQKIFCLIDKLKETGELTDSETKFFKQLSAIELSYISDVLYQVKDFKTAALLWEIIKDKGE